MRYEFISCYEALFFHESSVNVLTVCKESKLCDYLFLLVTFKANVYTRIHSFTVVQIHEFRHLQNSKGNLSEGK